MLTHPNVPLCALLVDDSDRTPEIAKVGRWDALARFGRRLCCP
jgi:hypothetical protein